MAKYIKSKIIASAQAYQQKGNFKKAIKEYLKILKEDPSDVRTRLRVAELWYKNGEHAKAVEAFKEVAVFYRDQGFLLKAVAVYKQILKIHTVDPDLFMALGLLYQQLGLIPDAITQFRYAISLLNKGGKTIERLKTIKQLLELDPENIPAKIRLAEEFSTNGMIQEAVSAFRDACETLKKKGMWDEYIKVAERLLYHQPDDLELSKELASHYIRQKDGLKALSRLQVCYRAQPNDREILEMLADSFEFLGQPQKSVTVLKELANNFDRSGLINERDEVMRRILTLNPDDQSAKEILHTVETAPEKFLEFDDFESVVEPLKREEDDEEIPISDTGEDTDVERKADVREISNGRLIVEDEIPPPPDEPSRDSGVRAEEPDFEDIEDETLAEDIEEIEFFIKNEYWDDAKALFDDLSKKHPGNKSLSRYRDFLKMKSR
ncbi:MAG: tetratricopeptide repeat protein [Deltaproteobacteria bacterium]|nr:tetratricopeptide repeat protein [Deltaproteobacteria bacterium]